jgi:uncharacterized protein with HEPN domain
MQIKDRDPKAFYFDIVQSIKHIHQFLDSGKIKTRREYQEHSLIKSAVERKLEVIGEAIDRIYKSDPSSSITRYRQIIAASNLINYECVFADDAQVWNIIEKYLPLLNEEAKKLL